MQKIIKRTALLLALALAMVCLGLFASACGDAKEFTITVYYADGTAVDGTKDGLTVQLCADSETNGFCDNDFVKLDANGVAKIDISKLEEKAKLANYTENRYVVHVWDNKTELELKSKVTVDPKNASVKVTLKDRNAQ